MINALRIKLILSCPMGNIQLFLGLVGVVSERSGDGRVRPGDTAEPSAVSPPPEGGVDGRRLRSTPRRRPS